MQKEHEQCKKEDKQCKKEAPQRERARYVQHVPVMNDRLLVVVGLFQAPFVGYLAVAVF